MHWFFNDYCYISWPNRIVSLPLLYSISDENARVVIIFADCVINGWSCKGTYEFVLFYDGCLEFWSLELLDYWFTVTKYLSVISKYELMIHHFC